MKFYYFGSDFPSQAVIWAADEAQAIKKYREDVCGADCMDKEEKAAIPCEISADNVARDLQHLLERRSEAVLDDADFRTGGLAGMLWSIVTTEYATTVWFEEP